ncbi:hypothetical protein C7974DRAFT_196904 [Boeremia exigua]|uniref:uncharacterized protein n=1 Tax=Boeremia exigua TaxID=749465 RepID=UPI001E8EECC5|nr:uncharacterized protein C7974DRAFT_196904 [Boeremia exigua]KAH6625248.1 hypothetical protein C7974DRAFT_196904 [Boeremia exigua]
MSHLMRCNMMRIDYCQLDSASMQLLNILPDLSKLSVTFNSQKRHTVDSTATDDWSRANEMDQHIIPQHNGLLVNHWPVEMQQPHPLPEVENPHNWQNMVAAADLDYSARRPHTLEAASQALQPIASISVMKEVVVETQPAFVGVQRSASMIALRQPSVTTEATGPLTPAVPDQSCAVAMDQIMAGTGGDKSSDSIRSERDLDIVFRDNAIPKRLSKPNRKASFKRTFGRAGSKVSNAVLAALRPSVNEPPVKLRAEGVMAEWQLFLSERRHEETAMEGAFDPFQHVMEQAMNQKYKELRGEGNFLVDDDAAGSTAAAEPVELPVEQEVLAATNDEEWTWVSHLKKEEHVTEFCDPYTGSVKRNSPSDSPRVSTDYMICHPPKPRTYPAGLPCPTNTTQSEEPEPVTDSQHDSTPSPKAGPQPTYLGEVNDKSLRTSIPASERESRLPKPTRSWSGEARTAHPVGVPRSRAPVKGRQDSVQPVASQAMQTEDKHATYQQADMN